MHILYCRCGHVKLGDLGSCARLAAGVRECGHAPVGTAEYAAPEVLAAAECASRHTVCLEYCRGIVANAIVGSHAGIKHNASHLLAKYRSHHPAACFQFQIRNSFTLNVDQLILLPFSLQS